MDSRVTSADSGGKLCGNVGRIVMEMSINTNAAEKLRGALKNTVLLGLFRCRNQHLIDDVNHAVGGSDVDRSDG